MTRSAPVSFGSCAALLLVLLLASSAGANPVSGLYADSASCDNHGTHPVVEEFGETIFPVPELFAISRVNGAPGMCGALGGGIADWEITITNLTGRALTNLYFVADEGFSFSNDDGTINGELAMRIDSVGVNPNLIFESGIPEGTFSPGESWVFVVNDFAAPLGVAPVFGSLGIPPGATTPSSNASLVMIPEPSTLVLMGLGMTLLAARRRRS